MPNLARKPVFDADAYLAWEAEQAEKHEYIDGDVLAMAGASDAHVTIALNLATRLRSHLRGSPCRVFMSDMKLQVQADNAFFYPDVLVTCATADREQTHYKSQPCLIAEVLSPSTSAYDRGEKFAAYRKLSSLQEYVLIDSERMGVEVFRRNKAGRWELHPFDAPGQHITLESVELRLLLDTLYEDVLPQSVA